ncbi:MAG: sugar ABC transporter permease [Actinomycetia bacterium]|nr:sugar ABC transporter permease [Actinomycetes bacterium]
MDFLLSAESAAHKFLLMFLVIALFVIVMGVILFAVDRPKLPRWVPLVGFLAPALLLLGFGLLYPAIGTIRASFYDDGGQNFVALENYQTVLTNSDLLLVLRNTALWVFLVPLLATGFGLIYAVLVDRTRFEKVAKALIFLPMAISMVGASIIWKFVYDYKSSAAPQTGLANQFLKLLGFDTQQFLLNTPWNNFFLIAVMVWIQAGFAMTILSAAIKAIPDDIIEAAKLDGVSGFRMFRYVTLPSVRPAVVVVLTTIAMATLKVFDIVYTMTGGRDPNTSIVANEFYIRSFSYGQQGLGATLAVLLFILVIPILMYNVRQMRLSEEQR